MKKIIIICICSTFLMISGCQRYEGSRLNKDKEESNLEAEVDYRLQTIAKIRGTVDEVMKQAQEGRLSNLTFEEFIPYISPDAEELYTIKLKQPTENYKGLEREELLEEEITITEHCFSDTSKGEDERQEQY